MRGINKVILVGRLGKDPECFNNEKGVVVNITIATSESYRDRTTNEEKKLTEWHRVVLFNKTAEIAQQYLRKGSKVYIEGRMKTRQWRDQQGVDHYRTEVVAKDMQMLDGQPTRENQPSPRQSQPTPDTGGYPQQQGGYPQQQGGFQRSPATAPQPRPIDNPYGQG